MMRNTGTFGISDKRGRARTSDDPYSNAAYNEPCFCTQCHAIYQQKRWFLASQAERPNDAQPTTCPACLKIADHFPRGIVTLQCDYFWRHEEEIRNLLHNVEQQARQKNPLERIMRIETEEDSLVIETTEQKLAEHLGRAVHKAHQGELDISRPKDHLNCRVVWNRTH